MKKAIIIALLVIAGITVAQANIVHNLFVMRKFTKCELLTKDTTPAILPFTIENGWIVVELEVKVQGGIYRKEKFILDTGAPISLLDDFAQAQGIKTEQITIRQSALSTSATTQKSSITAKPMIFKLGTQEVLQPHVMVMQDNMSISKCMHVAGLLGSNLLSKFVVDIDFGNNIITLYHKKAFNYQLIKSYDHKISFMPLLLQMNPFLSMTYQGKEFSGILDLGFNGGSVMLESDSATLAKMNAGQAANTVCYETYAAVDNVNGTVKNKTTDYRIQHASMLNDDKDTLAVNVVYMRQSGQSHLTLGINFAKEYHKIVIDWNKNDLYLIGRDTMQLQTTPPAQVRLKYLDGEKQFVAGLVDRNSSFYQHGLRAGDIVFKINNNDIRPIATGDKCDLENRLKLLSNTASSFTIDKDGKEIVITK